MDIRSRLLDWASHTFLGTCRRNDHLIDLSSDSISPYVCVTCPAVFDADEIVGMRRVDAALTRPEPHVIADENRMEALGLLRVSERKTCRCGLWMHPEHDPKTLGLNY